MNSSLRFRLAQLCAALAFVSVSPGQVQPKTPPPAGTSWPAPPTAVTGRVSTEKGGPVVGARVVAVRRWSPSPASGPAAMTTLTDGRGRYEFTALSSGAYWICVQPVDSVYVDPCTWNLTPAALNVVTGQGGGADITLPLAATVRVQVDDPDRAVADWKKAKKGLPFLLGPWTPNQGFLPAQPTTEDASGQTYRLTVPFDTDVTVAIHPGQLAFEDAQGKKLKNDELKFKVRAKKGDPEPIIRVSAKNP